MKKKDINTLEKLSNMWNPDHRQAMYDIGMDGKNIILDRYSVYIDSNLREKEKTISQVIEPNINVVSINITGSFN